MDKKERKILLDEIKNINSLNHEQKRFMFKIFIETYLHSMISYGFNDEITNEVRTLWSTITTIDKEEKRIYNFIINNSDKIDINSALELIDLLDELNEETIKYYTDAFEDILDSCEMKVKWRAQHRKKKFNTLLETDEYKLNAFGLTLNIDKVKEFLNYPEEFWNYIEDKTAYLDNNIEENQAFYSVLMKFDEDNNLTDMRVYVPIINNLSTALINIHEFKHAYDIYLKLGQKIINEEELELVASKKEEEFIREYVKSKIK